MAGFLQRHVAPEIDSVDSVELEYAEEGDLNPSSLLGELGGSRGSGQTSPDLAFLVNRGQGLVLTENKLVEHSFYGCSARRRYDTSERPGNPDPGRCEHALAVLDDPQEQCHQVAWGRKYWEHVGPAINREMMFNLKSWSAAHAGYQLFRQQALAEGIASSGKYGFVVSCVAVDERNEALATCLKGTGIPNLSDWPNLFQGKARFAVFNHQQWVGWIRSHGVNAQWKDWLSYVEARYGYSKCPPIIP